MSGKAGLKELRGLVEAKEWSAGLGKAEELLGRSPDEYLALVLGGLCADEEGQPHKARDLYARALRLSPDKPPALQGLAQLHRKHPALAPDQLLEESLAKLTTLLQGEKRDQALLQLLECRLNLHGATAEDEETLRSLLKDSSVKEKAAEALHERLFPARLPPSESTTRMAWDAFGLFPAAGSVRKLRFAMDWMGLEEVREALGKLGGDDKDCEEVGRLAAAEGAAALLGVELGLGLQRPEELCPVLEMAAEGQWEDAEEALEELSLDVDPQAVDLIHLITDHRLQEYQRAADRASQLRHSLTPAFIKKLLGEKITIIRAKSILCLPNVSDSQISDVRSDVEGLRDKGEAAAVLVEASLVAEDAPKGWEELDAVKTELGTESETYWSLRWRLEVLEGKEEEAQESLRLGLAKRPESGALRLGLGEWLWRRGRRDVAVLREMAAAAKAAPLEPLAYLRLGQLYAEQGKWDKAARCARRALQLDRSKKWAEETAPLLSDALAEAGEADDREHVELLEEQLPQVWASRRLAILHIAQRRLEPAIHLLQRLITLHPSGLHYRLLGDAYLERGSLDSARRAYGKALECLGEGEAAELELEIRTGQLRASVELCEWTAALEEADELGKMGGEPGFLLLRALSGAADALEAEGRLPRAIDYRVRALTLLPRLIGRHSSHRFFWKTATHLSLTLADVSQAACLNEDHKARMDKALSELESKLSLKKESDQKLALTRLAIRLSGEMARQGPEVADGWTELGLAYVAEVRQLGQATEAAAKGESCLRRALELSRGTEASAWLGLGELGLRRGQLRLAQHCFVRAADAGGEPAAEGWAGLAGLYLKTEGKEREARQALSGAQAAGPSLAAVWRALSHVAASVGHPDAADLARHSLLLGDDQTSLAASARHLAALPQDSAVPFLADAAERLVLRQAELAPLQRALQRLHLRRQMRGAERAEVPACVGSRLTAFHAALLSEEPLTEAGLGGLLGRLSEAEALGAAEELVSKLLSQPRETVTGRMRASLLHSFPHLTPLWALAFGPQSFRLASHHHRAILLTREENPTHWAKFVHMFPYKALA